MRKIDGILAAVALLMAAQNASAGDIVGKVTLKGTPPAETAIPLDPSCGKLHAGGLKTRFYAVDSSGGLGDVFVYIKEGVTGKDFPAPAEAGKLDQVGCEYTPYVSGLRANQKLQVFNSDPVLHNVHPTPQAAGNKEQNLAQLPQAKPLDFAFPSPEIFVRFKCDVHPWMFAYVGVMNHPYYAVTGKDGSFKIANVPAGKYVVEVIHRKTHPTGKGITKEITVGADGGKLDFTVELPAK